MTGPDWVHLPARVPDGAARAAAAARLDGLTKPRGALGALEGLVCHLAALQGTPTPALERVHITVFAADHGVTRHGVSAYPPDVTVQMVRNFSAGGAAINVLAGQLGAALEVVDLGTATEPGPLPGVISTRLGPGSADFTAGAALTPAQLEGALAAGRDAIARAAGAQAFIGGEMGIGNTTAAAALGCALLALPAAALCGPGTGLDAAGVTRKAQVVAHALALHAGALADPGEALRCVGGFEIAALAGAYIAAAQRGLPVLLDGFICAAAALAAVRINPGIAPWLLPMHRSAEPGHDALLAALPAALPAAVSGHALLDLGLRLGEGTGAATAVPLARLACALNAGMASFAQAGVDTAIEGDAPNAPATAHGAARPLPSGGPPLPANGSVPNVEPDIPSGAGMDPARPHASDTAASAGTGAVPHAGADRAPTAPPHAAPAAPPQPTPAAAGGPGANIASAGACADTPGTGRPAGPASPARKSSSA